VVNPVSDGSKPATEWMRVVSRLSSKLIEGRIVGMRFANIVFPAPGGPISSGFGPPARFCMARQFPIMRLNNNWRNKATAVSPTSYSLVFDDAGNGDAWDF
jgi:hypothetical protein